MDNEDLQERKWFFANPLPDLQGNKESGTVYDGADVAVSYLKKYLVKNLKLLKSGFPDDVKDAVKLVWYWILRVPFYTVGPSLRVRREKPPPPDDELDNELGLIYLGSYHASTCEMLALGML